MFDKPGRILRPDLPEGKRILVVSDIHANLDYFKGLLDKCGFCDDDILIIDGDFLEKGSKCLDTLRFVMQLCEKGNTYAVCGNCDDWAEIFNHPDYVDRHVEKYVRSKGRGLLWEMCLDSGIDTETFNLTEVKPLLRKRYEREFEFLARIPHAIETENFVFAHAGMDKNKSLDEHTADELFHRDCFLSQGFAFDKWVVVGHWPVMLYGTDIVSANPIIDHKRRIVCIDGGCVLKDDGQLNALIIPHKLSNDLSCISYDHFPTARVKTAQQASPRSYYIRWGDSTVEVLERGAEFSRCRHVRTGYEMDILTKYLFTQEKVTDCNDCTDYALPLEAGDTVSIIETTSRGYFVKHKGISGWYFGDLY